VTLVARHAALTDIGLHRKTNEDTFVVQPPLYAICDGMGGAQAGEVASGLAAETLAHQVVAGAELGDAAQAANAAVFARANANVEQTGMGTTLTALLLDGDEARFAHVGDSRAYLLRDGELTQLTDDHSLVGEMMREGRLTADEAAVHPHRSILSRALGTEPTVRIDEFAVDLRGGDALLLCSDGLCGVVPADTLRRHLARPDPDDAARRLIQEARKLGGPDNITAVVLRLDDEDQAGAVATQTAAAAAAPAAPDEVTAELGELEAETAEVSGAVAPHDAPGDGEVAGGDDAADATDAATAAPLAADAASPEEAVDSAAAGASSAGPAGPAAHARGRRRLLWLTAVLVVVLVAAVSGALVMSLCYYVGVDNGRLAVYSGLPVSVGPLDLHVVYRKSGVSYSSLGATARRFVDAEQVGTRGEVLDVAASLGMWQQ
jgi:PPM family protein phosphatase